MSKFTTEYREQTKKNQTFDNKHFKKIESAENLHEFYQDVTVAGKARYLDVKKPKNGIVMPGEFKYDQVQMRLTKNNQWNAPGWQTQTIEPRLIREEFVDTGALEDE